MYPGPAQLSIHFSLLQVMGSWAGPGYRLMEAGSKVIMVLAGVILETIRQSSKCLCMSKSDIPATWATTTHSFCI